MATTSKATELREQRASLAERSGAILDGVRDREITADEQAQFDELRSQYSSLEKEIALIERREDQAKIEAELRQSQGRQVRPGRLAPEPTEREFRQALRDWCLAGSSDYDLTPDAMVRAQNCGISLRSNNLNLRALSKASGGVGGYTVPTLLESEIVAKQKFYAPMRQYCRVITTDTGADLDWPQYDDSSNVAAIVSEASSVPVNVDPSFTKVTLKAFKWASPTVLLSTELIQDSAVNIESVLADMLAARMGRGQAAAMTVGGGSSTFQGVVTGSTVGVNLASGNAFTYAKLKDLEHSLDISYRFGASFMCHDATFAALEKLVDDNARPLLQPDLTSANSYRLFGYPVLVNNDFAEYAGSEGDNKPLVLFGNFSTNYVIRDVGPSLQVVRLNELYAATSQVGFVILQRTDARYIGHSGCVKSLNSYDAP